MADNADFEPKLDRATFDRVLAEEVERGTESRLAESRARAAAIRAAAGGNGNGEGGPAGGGVAVATRAPAGGDRLLSLVTPEDIQRVQRQAGDRVTVFPHLLLEELIAAFIVLVMLTVFATFVDAPLRELANPNLTPNPAKAPWYFLGLQELLRYFHPTIAGIVIPTFILLGLMAIPYIDRNPSTKPGDRKLAIMIFTMLFMFGATLTIIGSFFRGPGYNWVWPWSQGIFFEL